MNTNLVGWMFRKLEDDSCVYRIQLKTSSKRVVNKVSKEIGGKIVGEGFAPQGKETVLIFEKIFKNQKEWITFAKGLEFNVKEYNNRTGKYKEISKRRPGRPRKNQ